MKPTKGPEEDTKRDKTTALHKPGMLCTATKLLTMSTGILFKHIDYLIVQVLTVALLNLTI